MTADLIALSKEEHDELISLAEISIRYAFDNFATFDEKERLIKKAVRLGCRMEFIDELKRDNI